MANHREQFEAWARNTHDLKRDSGGDYISPESFECFETWKAAREITPEMVEICAKAMWINSSEVLYKECLQQAECCLAAIFGGGE